jgi:broad specificity phosphatase PhoE
MNASTQVPATSAAQRQVRRLYVSLLEQQSRFDEFKYLLARYPVEDETSGESTRARDSRDVQNRRIREWLLGDFDGLSPAELLLWRSIIVDERLPPSSRWGEETSFKAP